MIWDTRSRSCPAKLTATEATDTPQVEIHVDDNGSPSATALHTLTVDTETLSGALTRLRK